MISVDSISDESEVTLPAYIGKGSFSAFASNMHNDAQYDLKLS